MKVRQLLDILTLEDDHFDSYTDYMVEVVSIYSDQDQEEVYDLPIAELRERFEVVMRVLALPAKASKEIEIEGTKFHKLPFEKLTLGAYIDLDYYLQNPADLSKVAAVLYRRAKDRGMFETLEYEDYGDWVNHREQYFLELPVDQIAGIKVEYIEFRARLQNQYSVLFDTYVEDDDFDEIVDEKTRLEAENAKRLDETRQAFAWENTIMMLVNNNAADFEKIFKLPVILVFNILSTIKINKQ